MSHAEIAPPEKGMFVIVGPQSKVIKLLSNEALDPHFICGCFQDVAKIKPDDILGLRTQNGTLIRLTNPKLSDHVDGKLCTLELKPQQNDQSDEKGDQQIPFGQRNHEFEVKGWNLLSGKTQAAHWYSTGDGGNSALKQMNDWMKENGHCKVQYIYKDFMYANSKYHYWYGLVFTTFHEQ
eukprot:4184_1